MASPNGQNNNCDGMAARTIVSRLFLRFCLYFLPTTVTLLKTFPFYLCAPLPHVELPIDFKSKASHFHLFLC